MSRAAVCGERQSRKRRLPQCTLSSRALPSPLCPPRHKPNEFYRLKDKGKKTRDPARRIGKKSLTLMPLPLTAEKKQKTKKSGLLLFPPPLAPAAPPPAAAEDAAAPGARPDVGRVQDVLLQGENRRERERDECSGVDSLRGQFASPFLLSTSSSLLDSLFLLSLFPFSLSLSLQLKLSLPLSPCFVPDRPLLDQVDAPVGE